MIQYQAPLLTYVSDLVHTGSDVLALRVFDHPAVSPHRRHWAAESLTLATGAFKRVKVKKEPPEKYEGIRVGPEVLPLVSRDPADPREGPLPTSEAVILEWGYRYANFQEIALLQGRVVGTREPYRRGENDPGHRHWADTFSPVRTAIWAGPQGGLRCAPEIPPKINDSRSGRLARHSAYELQEVMRLPGENYNTFAPDTLLATADGKTVHVVFKDGGVSRVETDNPAGRRVALAGTLERQPDDAEHGRATPVDAKTSPDGTKLYVSWEGYLPSEGGLSVYRTSDYAAETHFKFQAGLLAPSPDGLSLAFLDGFGGRGNPNTITVIDVC